MRDNIGGRQRIAASDLAELAQKPKHKPFSNADHADRLA